MTDAKPKPTLEQLLARHQGRVKAVQARIDKRATAERAARTHRLCRFGGAFDAIINDDLLAQLDLMPDALRRELAGKIEASIKQGAPRP